MSRPEDLSRNDFQNYSVEILTHMLTEEQNIKFNDSFLMEIQRNEVNETMREKLIVWTIEMCTELKFSFKTKYNAILYIDLYLSRTPIQRSSLQLLGMVSIFLSIKLEETIKFTLDDVMYLSAGQYSKEEIIKMEFSVLSTLRWKLTQPNVGEMARILFNFFVEDPQPQSLANIDETLDFCLSSYEFIKFNRSSIVCSCIFYYLNEINCQDGKIIFQNFIESLPISKVELNECLNLLFKMTEDGNFHTPINSYGFIEEEKSTANTTELEYSKFLENRNLEKNYDENMNCEESEISDFSKMKL